MEDKGIWSQTQCRLMAKVPVSFAADKRKINVGFRSEWNQKENRQLLALIRNKPPVPIAVTRQQAPPRQQEIGWQTEVRKKLYRPDYSDRMRVWRFPALCNWAKSCPLPPGGVPDPQGAAGATRTPSANLLHMVWPPLCYPTVTQGTPGVSPVGTPTSAHTGREPSSLGKVGRDRDPAWWHSLPEYGQQIPEEGVQMVWVHQVV